MKARYGRDGKDAGGNRFIIWWCPGCDEPHSVPIEGPKAWGFQGPDDKPTLTPSVLVYEVKNGNEVIIPRCHCYVRTGQVQFLNDCGHKMAGKLVDLPDWPEPNFMVPGEQKSNS